MRPSQNIATDKGNASEVSSLQLKADLYAGDPKPTGAQANDTIDIPAELNQAGNFTELASSWLRLMAKDIEGFEHGMIVVKNDAQDAFVPIALWPNQPFDLHTLTLLAQSALKQHKSLESPTLDRVTGLKGFAVAVPIDIEQTPLGAVVFRLRGDDRKAVIHCKQLMQWGLAWLSQSIWRDNYRQSTSAAERSAFITDLLLLVAEKPHFQEALLSVVNDLATRLQLKRASLGWLEKGNLRVKAISHTAHFQHSHEAIQRLSQAMEEAFDQGSSIVLPCPDIKIEQTQGRLITSDHQQLLAANRVEAVASFLIQSPGKILGILTFEYPPGHKLGADDVLLGDLLGSALAPLLSEKRQTDRWLGGKTHSLSKTLQQALLGEEHPVYKLGAFALVVAITLLVIVQGDFRITAKTVIEGLVQRAAVAPFDGFIAQAPVRAGDHVRAGQLVANLDDKDILLEKVRLEGEVAQNVRKYRDALAKHDRANAGISGAQLEQSEAQLALVSDKLERSAIKAPFDGIIVSGDLSQKLGAPVEQGDVLFEITPLDAYRIILKVDERDIGYVQPGQAGQLTLTGLTAEKLPFTVKKVTPVAVAEEGINYFRVEAELVGEKPLLRPGMEGVGKILVGEESLWRIWTRRLSDWLSISLWTWLP